MKPKKKPKNKLVMVDYEKGETRTLPMPAPKLYALYVKPVRARSWWPTGRVSVSNDGTSWTTGDPYRLREDEIEQAKKDYRFNHEGRWLFEIEEIK